MFLNWTRIPHKLWMVPCWDLQNSNWYSDLLPSKGLGSTRKKPWVKSKPPTPWTGVISDNRVIPDSRYQFLKSCDNADGEWNTAMLKSQGPSWMMKLLSTVEEFLIFTGSFGWLVIKGNENIEHYEEKSSDYYNRHVASIKWITLFFRVLNILRSISSKI